MSTMPYLLEMRGIGKRFGAVTALEGVGFSLQKGEIHTLMGENGAGKSTLMKILMGLYQPDSGTISINGVDTPIASPRDAARHGLAMIHQELYPILDMTVADNLFVGRERRSLSLGPLSLVDRRRSCRQAEELLGEMGLQSISPRTPMRRLSVAETQLVEIIKAVSQGAEIIIMDEPTSAITLREAERLFEHMAKLKAAGVSIIYISHKMEEIFRVSDRITVLRDGGFIACRNAAELTPDALVKMMVGREIQDVYPKRPLLKPGGIALEVEDLADAGKISGVSFSLRYGEILGMAGLMGSGRTETAECIFGLNPRRAGVVKVNGRTVNIRSPRDAIRRRIALVSDDRKLKGLNLEGSVGENISLLRLPHLSRLGVIDSGRERERVGEYMRLLNVKAAGSGSPVSSLSGGNQQKVVLAKWLLSEPEIIIFDEPTRGIDVGAKHEIYLLMNRLAESGKAILMISSEMPEIVGMADRVVVMADGRLAGELGGGGITQEGIMALASNLPVAAP